MKRPRMCRANRTLFSIAQVLLVLGILVTIMIIARPMRLGAADERQHEVAECDDSQYIEVVVMRGDSIWDLALQHGTGSGDLRRLVHNIKEVNNLDSYLIHPGQRLLIPVGR